jgi:hypothetical protein
LGGCGLVFSRRKKGARAGGKQRRLPKQTADSGDVIRRPKSGGVLPAVSFRNHTVVFLFFVEEPPVNRSAFGNYLVNVAPRFWSVGNFCQLFW